ncbi:hypothetical protein [Rubellimicrobium aerolatum]|uniref:Rap1a immunity protein domain-containing protein n=1 Tax=Rubellimicrobium aerolatum TaxID=490979 RepID=A0ABW0SBR0_9RHOB|nr:hypothetical protein [Rubellimicrobium aerolatum]MBP1805942.1 hypothetical protein [Rubellimicrobium aerolatum]
MIRLVLLLLLAAGPALADRPRDPGGSVALRVLEIAALEARGEEKRVAGDCLSACTMYLGLSTACFEPDAVLGFHGPRLAWGLPMTPATFEAVTRTMAAYYPPRIARRFLDDWRHTPRFARVEASRLIARGEARACD